MMLRRLVLRCKFCVIRMARRRSLGKTWRTMSSGHFHQDNSSNHHDCINQNFTIYVT